MEAEEKAGEGGSPLTDGPRARCAIFDVGKPNSERVRIKNPRIYGFLIVCSRVIGWASLFYDLKCVFTIRSWAQTRVNHIPHFPRQLDPADHQLDPGDTCIAGRESTAKGDPAYPISPVSSLGRALSIHVV